MAGRALLVVSSVAVIGVAVACLPSLEVASPPPFCGDGTIDPDAGEECDLGDAGGADCVSCKVACTSGNVPFRDDATGHCYFSLDFTSQIADAKTACEARGAHVVRVVSDGEMQVLAGSARTGDIWIGLQRDTTASTQTYLPIEATIEPGWARDCTGCYAHLGTSPTIPVDPDIDGGGSGPCVIAQEALDKPWYQSDCNPTAGSRKAFQRSTICEREPAGSRARYCTGDVVCLTTRATQDHKRYLLVPSKVGASDAVQLCQSSGGRLVVFESREEREQLAAEIAGQSLVSARDFWIGLGTDGAGAWRWDVDSPLAPADVWGVKQPQLEAGAGRAFVVIAQGTLDSELARAGDATDAGAEQHYVVCEL